MKLFKNRVSKTSDRVNTGTTVLRVKTMATNPASNVHHAGQPKKMSGRGLKTGHTKTNY